MNVDQATLFRLIVQNSIDPVVLLRADGEVVFASPALEQVLGRTPGVLEGRSVFEIIHPDDLAEAADRFAALASGAPSAMELRARRNDDSWMVLECVAQALFDEHGNISIIVGVAHDVTERRRAEEQLAESEGLFRTMFDQAFEPAGIVRDGRYVEVNQAFLDLLGYRREELIGYPAIELIPPEHRQHVVTVFAGSGDAADEVEVLRKDGHRVIVRARIRRIVYRGRHMILIVADDVTALRRTEERFRELVDTLDAIVWEADVPSFRFTFVSRAAEAILGHPVEAWLEEDFWLRHLHPDDREATAERCAAEAAAGRDHQLNYRMIAADGRVVWLEDTVRVVHDEDGRVRGLRGVMIDTTDRELARLELARMEARYHALFEHAADPVTLTDDHGRIIETNRAMKELFGYTDHDVVGHSGLEFTVPEDHHIPAERMLPASPGQPEGGTYEMTAIAKDGTLVPVEISARAVHGPDGDKWYIGTARDIRERRELEAQLRQAQKLEAVGRLAGSVAHDFNNLLAAIISSVELATRRVGDGPGRRHIDQIADTAERARRLTAQLLAFGRAQVLRPEVLAVNDVVAGVEELLTNLTGDEVELVLTLGREAGVVEVDRGQLEQVLVNLVVNARDAIDGPGRITIETSEAPGQVVLAVTDTGRGIAKEHREHLFEPFFTTKADGSGLGLSTVHGIVNQSGGSVAVVSEVGVGTRFEVVLPAADQARAVPAPPPRDIAASQATDRASILLVEDEPTVREAMADLLRAEGHTVVAAADAEEALDRWQDDPAAVDILVTDVVMPRMTGPELYAELSSSRPTLRAVLMSGYAAGVLDEAAPSGTVFLQKPFLADELLTAIAALGD